MLSNAAPATKFPAPPQDRDPAAPITTDVLRAFNEAHRLTIEIEALREQLIGPMPGADAGPSTVHIVPAGTLEKLADEAVLLRQRMLLAFENIRAIGERVGSFDA